jgi:hypothetical protein
MLFQWQERNEKIKNLNVGQKIIIFSINSIHSRESKNVRLKFLDNLSKINSCEFFVTGFILKKNQHFHNVLAFLSLIYFLYKSYFIHTSQ